MFDDYAEILDYINLDTAKAYSKMISEFIMYSLEVNPDDLELFLKKKSSLSIKEETLKLNWRETSKIL